MEFHPSGAGVVLKAKHDPLCTFLIPFANIPYVIVEEDEKGEQENEEAQTKVIRRRRRRSATAEASGSQELQESEGGASGPGASVEDEISERLPF